MFEFVDPFLDYIQILFLPFMCVCEGFYLKMADEEVQSSIDVSLTQQTQTARNETNAESQEPEAVREPSVSPNKRGLKSDVWSHYKRQKIDGVRNYVKIMQFLCCLLTMFGYEIMFMFRFCSLITSELV